MTQRKMNRIGSDPAMCWWPMAETNGSKRLFGLEGYRVAGRCSAVVVFHFHFAPDFSFSVFAVIWPKVILLLKYYSLFRKKSLGPASEYLVASDYPLPEVIIAMMHWIISVVEPPLDFSLLLYGHYIFIEQ